MKVLVCGAAGFIGGHIARRLERTGLTVIRGSSHGVGGMAMDFRRDLTTDAWLARLRGIEAVVNAVGVLRDSPRRPMDSVHARAPAALFEACAAAGVRRVVQLSAYGIAEGDTRYATSKRQADERLLRLDDEDRLQGVALRPSIVFGREGASSRLFMTLARLPVLALPPRVLDARVQPLRVEELAEAVKALLTRDPRRGLAELGGPVALTVADLIASLRRQMGHAPARVIRLPAALVDLSLRLGDALPITPWGSQTNALLARDNVTDSPALAELLGRPATPPSRFLERA